MDLDIGSINTCWREKLTIEDWEFWILKRDNLGQPGQQQPVGNQWL